jgi:hypothetical protein
MRRQALQAAGLAGIAAAVIVFCPAAGASTAADCSAFSAGGLTFHSETNGSGFTCRSAKMWILKLSKDRVPGNGTVKVPIRNGPAGYRCSALIATHGRAAGGTCFKGSFVSPTSGFDWAGM